MFAFLFFGIFTALAGLAFPPLWLVSFACFWAFERGMRNRANVVLNAQAAKVAKARSKRYGDAVRYFS